MLLDVLHTGHASHEVLLPIVKNAEGECFTLMTNLQYDLLVYVTTGIVTVVYP